MTTLLSPREAYGRWAKTYDESLNPLLSLIERNLLLGDISGKVAIDVACGTGRRAAMIGVDQSFEMLSRAKGRVVQGDARTLPFADGVADLIVCTLALGYITPVRDAMAELRRVARPGGTIIAADLHPSAIAAGWKRCFRDGSNNCEIENFPYSMDDLSVPHLLLDEARDLFFGEPEREIYRRAGKISLFEEASRIPAAWVRRWRRL